MAQRGIPQTKSHAEIIKKNWRNCYKMIAFRASFRPYKKTTVRGSPAKIQGRKYNANEDTYSDSSGAIITYNLDSR